MALPKSDILPIEKLGSVFNNTAATYKYYWFLSILDLVVKEGKTRLSIWEVVANMVASAWYPIHYFHISFGKSDSMDKQIRLIREETSMPIDLAKKDIVAQLLDPQEEKKMHKLMRVFTLNVPYRFLMPWLNTTDDKLTVEFSRSFHNQCLYSLTMEDGVMYVTINPQWLDYMTRNYAVLHDFAYWNLTLFLQSRNPNVPNIPSKLIKPITRSSLTKQHNYWDTAMRELGDLHCIYTDKPLAPKGYDLDHFIPWSFVAHDQIWNLIPIDGSINSSKSDRLPNLDKYLLPMARKQQQAARAIYHKSPNNNMLEDYLTIVNSVQDLLEMDTEHLADTFDKVFRPMEQIARNMNFEMWEY